MSHTTKRQPASPPLPTGKAEKKTYTPIIRKLGTRLGKVRTLHQQPLMRREQRLGLARPNQQRDDGRRQVLRKRDARRGRVVGPALGKRQVRAVRVLPLRRGYAGRSTSTSALAHLDVAGGGGGRGRVLDDFVVEAVCHYGMLRFVIIWWIGSGLIGWK